MAGKSKENKEFSSVQPGTLPDDHDEAVQVVVEQLKSQGIFDSIRKECLSDIDARVSSFCLLVSPCFFF